MTTIATRAPARTAEVGPSRGGGALAGTGALIRFILRRDRIKLPAWLLGITVFVLYYGAALPELYQTETDLQAAAQFGDGPVGALLGGPGYGFDDLTVERLIVGIYGLYFLIVAALMNILLVSRHTRVDEQTGRAELVRASVVGRHAHLTAVMIVAVAANAVLSVLIAGAIGAADLDTSDGLLFGASIGAAGLAFAGITALTVQVTEYSRAAAGIAGAALGAAYVIRAAGDMLREHGSALSWFSPLAWSQQTRAYVDGRWWPLALSVGFAAAAAAAGYALSARRDLGAGLVAARRGRAGAAGWLRSPFAFALRLQRAALLWWAFALAAAGVVYGAITEQLVEAYADMPDTMLEVLGGDRARLLDGYLSVMPLFMAIMVGIYAIIGVQLLRLEETRGRAEPVLATGTGRWAWFGSHLAVLALGVVGLMLVAGVTFGGATAISVGDAGYFWEITVANLAHVPAVLVVMAIAALLFGVVPRAVGLAWVVLGYGMILGFFGPLMDLPRWAFNLSPFEHIARAPLDPLTWPPVLILAALAVGLAVVGLAGFRRRDLETK